MNRAPRRNSGFTLVELLTVIAIIGILAGLIATALPRVLEKAKITNLQNIFNQLRTSLTTYYTDHNTYPPGYGSIDPSYVGIDFSIVGSAHMVYKPFLAYLESFGNKDLYDPFSETFNTYDTDRNGSLSGLEFSPLGQRSGQNATLFDDSGIFGVFDSPGVQDEVSRQSRETQRPLLYIPINKRQAQRVYDAWYRDAGFVPGDLSTAPVSALSNIQFPPPSYDAAVLISVGPSGSTYGLVNVDQVIPGITPPVWRYHMLGIYAYFFATRDADGNGVLDFDWVARTREAEGKIAGNDLPDPTNKNAAGPMIYVIE